MALLLAHKASLSLTIKKDGYTPLGVAKYYKATKIIAQLKAAGARK